MFSESVRAISLVSMMLTLAGTLSGSIPEPAMGVVGYTTTVGGLRTTRDAFWERPGLALVGVGDTTTGWQGLNRAWRVLRTSTNYTRQAGIAAIDTINSECERPSASSPTPAVLGARRFGG